MAWFRNLRTMTKLMLGFALVALLAGVVGWQGLQALGHADTLISDMYEKHALGLAHLKEANFQVLMASRGVRNAILDDNAADVERRIANMQKYKAAFEKEFDQYEKTLVLAEAKAKATEARKVFADVYKAQSALAELAKASKNAEAKAGLKQERALADDLDNRLHDLEQIKLRLMQQEHDDSEATYSSTRTFTIGLIALAMALAVALGYFIARLIARPLSQAVVVMEAVAAGDLTQRLEIATRDEVGQMAQAINDAVGGMNAALDEVRQSADEAARASAQLSAATDNIASGAQEQASSLEETAASLEEITGTVKQNADNAKQANQLAVGSRDTADKGGQVVTSAVQAMGEINRASKRIADIITTIDEIAFQTNLLALNAAVEAARAGEQGRGFAVVAAEVRNLAQRSATAAKEIKGLIEDSVQKVDTGSELVNKSGENLTDIVASVKRVTDIIAEISAASQEQTTGIEQVNRAVAQMDQVVQANAAQTEELSSTAQTLAGQAQHLQTLVARFNLDAGRALPVVARVERPAPAPPALAPRVRPALPPAGGRRKSDAPAQRRRKTDAPATAAVPAGNRTAHARAAEFEEF